MEWVKQGGKDLLSYKEEAEAWRIWEDGRWGNSTLTDVKSLELGRGPAAQQRARLYIKGSFSPVSSNALGHERRGWLQEDSGVHAFLAQKTGRKERGKSYHCQDVLSFILNDRLESFNGETRLKIQKDHSDSCMQRRWRGARAEAARTVRRPLYLSRWESIAWTQVLVPVVKEGGWFWRHSESKAAMTHWQTVCCTGRYSTRERPKSRITPWFLTFSKWLKQVTSIVHSGSWLILYSTQQGCHRRCKLRRANQLWNPSFIFLIFGPKILRF